MHGTLGAKTWVSLNHSATPSGGDRPDACRGLRTVSAVADIVNDSRDFAVQAIFNSSKKGFMLAGICMKFHG